MAVITEETIRELAAFRGEDAPVTTCYLDVDGRRLVRRQDYETELETLLRAARVKANGSASVATDLRKIEEYVKSGIDRSTTRGLAFFSCTAHDLWQVVPLPVPVQSRVFINAVPAVGPLELVVQDHTSIGVLLADRQRARLFVFELGELSDHSELFEELPRDYDERGGRDPGYDREQHHVDELAAQHLRHAAQAAFEVFQRRSFDCFTIGAPDPIVSELEGYLHPYLKDRLGARIPVSVTASVDEIRGAALDLESEVNRVREIELVNRLRDALGAGQKAVAGLTATLKALHEHRIDQLLVSSDFLEPGWVCEACGCLAPIGRTCDQCGTEGMTRVDDVVEEAIDHAMAQKAKVHVCVGNADLDVLGRIGALLRY